ncbi:MAG: insulinase family protein, partial [Cyanobacteria bacterium]|nr:insulinase family protein [Cyanobacteriota bacterium]
TVIVKLESAWLRKIYLVDRPGSVQSSIKVGNLGIKKTDPDYFNVTVMSQILGGGAHSRLFLNIREKKGYTYGAYSSNTSRVDPDSFAASADVRTEVTGPSLKEFIYELERIRDNQVTEEELRDAKNYLVGHFQLGLENQSGLAQRLLEVNLFDLPNDYLEKYSDKIMAVTVDDVQKAAKKAIHSQDLVITVVGDAKKIKEELDSYGPTEVFDTNGHPTTSSGKTTKSPDS